MKRRATTEALPPRRSDNPKRRLLAEPSEALIDELLRRASYKASAKHKRHPHRYGLDPFRGHRGDATLCDEHAGFEADDIRSIPKLLRRGIRAALIGDTQRMIWTVGDDGWIYEGRQTNPATLEFHGYPLRRRERIVVQVCRRFNAWAEGHGSQVERNAAVECRNRYKVR